MSLLEVGIGKKVLLNNMQYGLNLKKKLQDMGLTVGVEFSVISKTNSGPIIIEIRGSRVALGRGIAEKIDVEIAS